MQKLQIVLCSVPRARAGVKVHLKLSMCCALFRHTNRKGDEFLARAKNFVVVITICCGCASRLSYEPLFISPFLLSLSVLSLPLFPFVFPTKVWQLNESLPVRQFVWNKLQFTYAYVWRYV